jgi:hypothetical protein
VAVDLKEVSSNIEALGRGSAVLRGHAVSLRT